MHDRLKHSCLANRCERNTYCANAPIRKFSRNHSRAFGSLHFSIFREWHSFALHFASPTFERTRGLFTQPTSQQLFHLNIQNVRYLIHITFSVNFLNSYLHEISNEVYEINYLVVR